MRLNARGTAMVEFVLVLPLFLLLMFTMFYMAMVMHDYNTVNQLAREAVRYGAVVPIDGENEAEVHTKIEEYIMSQKDLLTSLYDIDRETVRRDIVIAPNDITGEKDISVRVTANANSGQFPLMVKWLANIFQKVEGKTQMRREL